MKPRAKMIRAETYIGNRFGRLLVVGVVPVKGKAKRLLCLCDCGVEKTIRADHLRDGTTVSCGCFGREQVSNANSTHGMSLSPEFKIWSGIKERCLNPNSHHFAVYSKRGICEAWANSFETFYADMGPRPGPEYSIDRINNDLGYEPSNCRWATAIQQNRNKRNARPVIRSDGRRYAHIVLAAQDVGGDPSHIGAVCRGLYAQHNGFGWRFATKEENA